MTSTDEVRQARAEVSTLQKALSVAGVVIGGLFTLWAHDVSTTMHDSLRALNRISEEIGHVRAAQLRQQHEITQAMDRANQAYHLAEQASAEKKK